MASSSRNRRGESFAEAGRYDQRLSEILRHATEVFCDRGYAAASMRDLSRVAGMSLAGLYHYFESKEKLLYLIQKHTFETILERAQERLQDVRDPEERIRIFIGNHIEYFLANYKSMKVLSHEDSVLRGGFGEEIRGVKRQYYGLCRGLVEHLKQERELEFSTRLGVLSLFGMMNWIYTWHNPKVDGDAATLSRHMADLFLRGVLGCARREAIFASATRKRTAGNRRAASARG